MPMAAEGPKSQTIAGLISRHSYALRVVPDDYRGTPRLAGIAQGRRAAACRRRSSGDTERIVAGPSESHLGTTDRRFDASEVHGLGPARVDNHQEDRRR